LPIGIKLPIKPEKPLWLVGGFSFKGDETYVGGKKAIKKGVNL